MLIQGGTSSTGMRNTVSVDGEYWMSCISSFSNTTLPGVSARLRPISNLLASDWRNFSSPWPASMSSVSIFMPRTRFSPFDASVSRRTSGLVNTKLEGEIAAAICLT